jgi:polyketide synthase PksN
MLEQQDVHYPPRNVLSSYPSVDAQSQIVAYESHQLRAKDPVATGGRNPFQTETKTLANFNELQQQLKVILAKVLRIDASTIDADRPFGDFGLDSLLGVEVTIAINNAFGTELSNARLFEYPTVKEFAIFLAQEIKKLPGFIKAPPARTIEDPAAQSVASSVPTRNSYPVLKKRSRPARAMALNEARPDDKIAVIGMSGKYPKADNLKQYWDNLANGRNCIAEVPRSRWDVSRFYDPDPAKKDKTNSKWLGVLDDVDCFDPLFFRIAPQDAVYMDPQHRLFLQESYKAFEDAGYSADRLGNKQCGVYLGIATNEYALLLSKNGVRSPSALSNNNAIGAARIAYYLNLKGPAISLDTACSSSLVAIHLACQGLLNHETDMALAGGVTLWLVPESYQAMSEAGMLSPEGQCKTFDDGANGIVVGEGVGAVVLKRLRDAQADGDHIYGVIVGSGINQDGRTNGITAPNVNSQIDLLREVYKKYKIGPETITYIETHGTGTKLGDPIELTALATVFKEKSQRNNYCALGSVKTNIGHTTAAAGIASVQKVLLSLQERTLVPSLNVTSENSRFDFKNSPFYVNRERRAWEAGSGLRRAGVSAFGFSGTNAHLVIEEYLASAASVTASSFGRDCAIALSAKAPEQLRQKAQDLLEFVRDTREGNPSRGQPLEKVDLSALAYTLQTGREAMDERLGFVVNSVDQLAEKLSRYLNGRQDTEGVYQGRVKLGGEGVIVGQDEDMQELVDRWISRKKLSKLLDLWVKGLNFDWDKLYGEIKPQRVSLPTYPFAKERYWIDEVALKPVSSSEGDPVRILHPLLHANTSDLSEQRYSTTFTGEEFFLADHQLLMEGGAVHKVLPGVAYLEMARAAVVQGLAIQSGSSIVELLNTIWLRPLVVANPTGVSIALLVDGDHDWINYEIYSSAAGQKTIHCHGQAVVSDARPSIKLDIEKLRAQMNPFRLGPSGIYAAFGAMGLNYGPAHQGIVALYQRENQVLAQLHLPQSVSSTQHDYILHPSLLDSALQASIGLIVDANSFSIRPPVPFALNSLRQLSACENEMFAWVRPSKNAPESKALDIDLCDRHGNICVQMKGFVSRILQGETGSAEGENCLSAEGSPDYRGDDSDFDDAFYRKLIDDIGNREVSVDEAVELG